MEQSHKLNIYLTEQNRVLIKRCQIQGYTLGIKKTIGEVLNHCIRDVISYAFVDDDFINYMFRFIPEMDYKTTSYINNETMIELLKLEEKFIDRRGVSRSKIINLALSLYLAPLFYDDDGEAHEFFKYGKILCINCHKLHVYDENGKEILFYCNDCEMLPQVKDRLKEFDIFFGSNIEEHRQFIKEK